MKKIFGKREKPAVDEPRHDPRSTFAAAPLPRHMGPPASSTPLADQLRAGGPGVDDRYVVLPRSIAEQMPLPWQRQMASVLAQFHHTHRGLSWPVYKVVPSRQERLVDLDEEQLAEAGYIVEIDPDGEVVYRDRSGRQVENPEGTVVLVACLDPIPARGAAPQQPQPPSQPGPPPGAQAGPGAIPAREQHRDPAPPPPRTPAPMNIGPQPVWTPVRNQGQGAPGPEGPGQGGQAQGFAQGGPGQGAYGQSSPGQQSAPGMPGSAPSGSGQGGLGAQNAPGTPPGGIPQATAGSPQSTPALPATSPSGPDQAGPVPQNTASAPSPADEPSAPANPTSADTQANTGASSSGTTSAGTTSMDTPRMDTPPSAPSTPGTPPGGFPQTSTASLQHPTLAPWARINPGPPPSAWSSAGTHNVPQAPTTPNAPGPQSTPPQDDPRSADTDTPPRGLAIPPAAAQPMDWFADPAADDDDEKPSFGPSGDPIERPYRFPG